MIAKNEKYNLVAVVKCEKSTSQGEHHNGLVKVYSRATSQEIPAFFCEIKRKHSQTFCQKENQIGSKISADRKLHGNTQERFYKADPDECMRHVRALNGTGIEKLDNLETTNTFTVLDRSIKNQIEKVQGKLEVKTFNTPYYHSWTYTLHDSGFKPNKYAYFPR